MLSTDHECNYTHLVAAAVVERVGAVEGVACEIGMGPYPWATAPATVSLRSQLECCHLAQQVCSSLETLICFSSSTPRSPRSRWMEYLAQKAWNTSCHLKSHMNSVSLIALLRWALDIYHIKAYILTKPFSAPRSPFEHSLNICSRLHHQCRLISHQSLGFNTAFITIADVYHFRASILRPPQVLHKCTHTISQPP